MPPPPPFVFIMLSLSATWYSPICKDLRRKCESDLCVLILNNKMTFWTFPHCTSTVEIKGSISMSKNHLCSKRAAWSRTYMLAYMVVALCKVFLCQTWLKTERKALCNNKNSRGEAQKHSPTISKQPGTAACNVAGWAGGTFPWWHGASGIVPALLQQVLPTGPRRPPCGRQHVREPWTHSGQPPTQIWKACAPHAPPWVHLVSGR